MHLKSRSCAGGAWAVCAVDRTELDVTWDAVRTLALTGPSGWACSGSGHTQWHDPQPVTEQASQMPTASARPQAGGVARRWRGFVPHWRSKLNLAVRVVPSK
jgi:hypothetical protein